MIFEGKIVQAKIAKIFKTHVICIIEDKKDTWKGLLHISEISDYFVKDIRTIISTPTVTLKVIGINQKNKTLKLSYKAIMPKYARNPFRFELKESPKGFANLKKWNNEWKGTKDD